eukprot:TRINITY_DN5006_c1_g3_i2.p1 TRINITY_DN5006_c1_g3~~TRINITY_DN5006_c1_g3_i2.p1  ORF type:complete len:264 (+),score=42.40 TRINITY_DN5006_c1_g3_i2:269-1060(+)
MMLMMMNIFSELMFLFWGIMLFEIIYGYQTDFGYLNKGDNKLNKTQLLEENVGALWYYRKDPDLAEEAISQKQYPVTTNWNPLELVNGVDIIHKLALRLDGYSTWVEGKHTMVDSISQLTLSVWVALSTYPSEKGALFALFNNLIIEIDCFGRLKVIFTTEFDTTIIDIKDVIFPRYEWVHLAIGVVPDEVIIVYLNGKLELMDALNSYGYQWPDSSEFFIGRHPDSDLYFGFDRNVLNGVVDEIVLYDKLLSQEEIGEIVRT